jgi:histidinol dehydrogenase
MPIRVTEEEFEHAEKQLSNKIVEALSVSIENVVKFHKAQRPESPGEVETYPGIFASERITPLRSAGLYVPRGKGSFPSMLYMLAAPAAIAGVPLICVTTPPGEGGTIDPACLLAAKLCGVHDVYRVGGAQAIAALAFGTESIPPVDKIVGPGNPYVTAAKNLLSGRVNTGLPAGPSESIIIADRHADPWKVALDLMIEAEHGEDSAALLITDSRELAGKVAVALEKAIARLPEPRNGFVSSVLSNYGGFVISKDIDQAVEIVNDYAPEHLQIQTQDPRQTLAGVVNASEILLGDTVPFSVANYSAGPNAVLPTGGNARTWSPVSVRDFIKHSSVIHASAEALEAISPIVATLAEYEGFPAHAAALTRRKDA